VLSKLTPQAFAPLEALFKKGRFKEEFNIELKLCGSHLCHVKVFTGRPPYYGPWAEVFNLSPSFVEPVGAPRLLRLAQIHGAGRHVVRGVHRR
jgi:hypothetical protein